MMYATTSLLSPILVAYAVSWNGFQARLLPPQAALPESLVTVASLDQTNAISHRSHCSALSHH